MPWSQLKRFAPLALAGLGLLGMVWAVFRRVPHLKRPVRAAAVGDSLTAHGGYTARLRAVVGGTWAVLAESGASLWRIVNLVRGRLTSYDTVVILGGVNSLDRGFADQQAALIELYRAARDQKADCQVIAVTMTPWRGHSSWTPERDEVRARLSAWQLGGASGFVDAAVDSMAALGDAEGRLRREYDSGDGLHLNAAGQQALGDAIARVFGVR